MEVRIDATTQAETLEQASKSFQDSVRALESLGFNIFQLKLNGVWIPRENIFKKKALNEVMQHAPQTPPTIAELDKHIRAVESHMVNSVKIYNKNTESITKRIFDLEKAMDDLKPKPKKKLK